MRSKSILLVMMVVLFVTGVSRAVVMDMVTVGNAGNIADTEVMGDGTTGYGSVGYTYQIGKYEVTAGQYTEFLNAVATTDTYGLYNTDMWSNDEYGCKIQQSGSSDSYTYSVAADWANRPVNFVSWYDTLRFTNWLHNGQGSGDTEDGAYDMSLGSSVVRKAGATVWLPSKDEWYKAAYHKNDGVTTGNYFEYPTSSDSIPSNDLVEPTDPGNNATFYDGAWPPYTPDPAGYTIGSPYYRTEVGAHENSGSPYGTFDMGGNVHEWNEAIIGDCRGARGGSCGSPGDNLRSSFRGFFSPDYEGNYFTGFRVASVPEPATLLLLGLGGLALRKLKIKK